jgi:hypothetical protein
VIVARMVLLTLVALAAIAGFVYLVLATTGHGGAEFGLFLIAILSAEAMGDNSWFRFKATSKEDKGVRSEDQSV